MGDVYVVFLVQAFCTAAIVCYSRKIMAKTVIWRGRREAIFGAKTGNGNKKLEDFVCEIDSLNITPLRSDRMRFVCLDEMPKLLPIDNPIVIDAAPLLAS